MAAQQSTGRRDAKLQLLEWCGGDKTVAAAIWSDMWGDQEPSVVDADDMRTLELAAEAYATGRA